MMPDSYRVKGRQSWMPIFLVFHLWRLFLYASYYLTNSIITISAPSDLLWPNRSILVYPPFLEAKSGAISDINFRAAFSPICAKTNLLAARFCFFAVVINLAM